MFNFFNELKTKLDDDGVLSDFNIISLSNRLVYIEGHRGILSFDDKVVVAKVKNGILNITGNKIKIKEMDKTTVTVIGDIDSVEKI